MFEILTLFQVFLSLIILVLPGYFFTLIIINRKIHWFEFFSVFITTGLTLNFVTLFFMNIFLKKPIIYSTILFTSLVLSFIFIISLFLFSRKKDDDSICNQFTPDFEDIDYFVSGILVFTLIFLFLIFLGVHSGYPLPYHIDEWLHISLSVQIIEESGIKFVIPYFPDSILKGRVDYSLHRLEAGFHILLSSFYILSGTDPVLSVGYLPGFIMLLTSLNIYSFVYLLTKDYKPAFFSIIFFSGLKSHITLLGPWILVPQALGFGFIFLILYCFESGRNGHLGLHIVGMVNLLGIALIHPQTAALLYLVFCVNSIITIINGIIGFFRMTGIRFMGRLNRLFSDYKSFLIGDFLYLFFPLLGFSYFLKILWKGTFYKTLDWFFTDFIFFGEMLAIPALYNPEFPLLFYGKLPAFIFVVGLLYIIYKRRYGILISGIISTAPFLIMYHYEGFTILMSYERLLYYLFIFMTPIAGIGLWIIINIPLKLSKKKNMISYLAPVIVLLVVYTVIDDYYLPRDQLAKAIKLNEYQAISWLSQGVGKGNIILARARISDTIYPISMNKVIAISPRGPGYSPAMKALHTFFMGDCEVKKKVLMDYDIDYLLDNQKLSCNYLKQVYSQDGIRIYKIKEKIKNQ